MRQYMAGTTSSSLYEARLGYEKFGGETHAYSVAYDDDELKQTLKYCDKIIFNSLTQLDKYQSNVPANVSTGLRLNPGLGFSRYSLSDTVAKYSRLGVAFDQLPDGLESLIDGVMLHMNCENTSYSNFSAQLDWLERHLAGLLAKLRWLSLGGGVAFTRDDYALEDFCLRLKDLSDKYQLQVYLEPGEASVSQSSSLVVTVLDLVDNGLPTLIVDAGVETHLLDVLIYRFAPALEGATAIEEHELEAALAQGKTVYRVCGRSCLAGDVFGNYVFDKAIAPGHQLVFTDVAGYSMVKKNFFNGIKMPSICHRDIRGKTRLIKAFSYETFRDFLS